MRSKLSVDVVPIKNNGVIEGAVITLKDIQQIKKLVKEATVSEIETHFSQIIGNSTKMNELKAMALHVAPSKATLLIQGESGTGKELLARAIHQSSNKARRTYHKETRSEDRRIDDCYRDSGRAIAPN